MPLPVFSYIVVALSSAGLQSPTSGKRTLSEPLTVCAIWSRHILYCNKYGLLLSTLLYPAVPATPRAPCKTSQSPNSLGIVQETYIMPATKGDRGNITKAIPTRPHDNELSFAHPQADRRCRHDLFDE